MNLANINLSNINENTITKILDEVYKLVLDGINMDKSIDEVAMEFLNKSTTKEQAIEKLIINQTIWCSLNGFVTSLPKGFLSLTIPVNVVSALYMQLRMVAVIAKIRGYNLYDEEVKTMCYATLVGSSISKIAKETGIKLGNKLAIVGINKISGKVLSKINKAVGFRLLTKFGSNGIINLGKCIPIISGLVGATVDGMTTVGIGNIAKKNFN